MANSSTITLLQSMEWCKKFVFNRQLSLGDFKEPLVSSANIIKQTILGPPFRWRWNRQIVTFNTIAPNPSNIGVQDYSVASNFGWIENASVQDTGATPSKWYQMEPKIDLALDTSKARPQFISGQLDDGAGNITFRLMPIPDKVYPISVTVQNKAALFTSLNQTWSPIPDEYSYIYQVGLLSYMYEFADDARWVGARQRFVAALLGANQGLTDTELNIFLNNWQFVSGNPISNQIQLSQGNEARGR
jgi:hypothetical protein